MRPPLDTCARGRRAECLAADYLALRGYRILDRNVRDGPRELDLLASHEGWAVVVEVRYRADVAHGLPEETIHPGKRRHLLRAGTAWWLREGRAHGPLRFDLVSIQAVPDGLVLRHRPHFLLVPGTRGMI